jgi:plastocyanin
VKKMKNNFVVAAKALTRPKVLASMIAVSVVLLALAVPSIYSTAVVGNSSGVIGGSTGCVVHVTINNYNYYPDKVKIEKGCTVTWTDKDIAIHTVTSNVPHQFTSHILAPGQSFSFKFTTAGNYGYHCDIHPFMFGVVVVTS